MDLVTGGAGFIGSHLVELLLTEGRRVRVLDDLSSGQLQNLAFGSPIDVDEQALQFTIESGKGPLEFVHGSITDRDVVADACAGVERVFHLAAVTSIQRTIDEPEKAQEINVGGTRAVLEEAAKSGVKALVFASSCAIYGNLPDLPKSERSPIEPLSPYAEHKLAGEGFIQRFNDGHAIRAVALRLFNVFGPRQNPAGGYAAAIPAFCTALATGQAPIIYGDGKQTRDFIYVGDVVRAMVTVAESEVAAGNFFNIGLGRQTSLLQLLEHLSHESDVEVSPRFEPERAGDVRHSRADVSFAAETFGFAPQNDLGSGLGQTYRYFKEIADR
jgi:UDP-N-acetylglucosamine/UDP-N-acetyl-alpha-D-glucosaminouronate 4-epimerase